MQLGRSSRSRIDRGCNCWTGMRLLRPAVAALVLLALCRRRRPREPSTSAAARLTCPRLARLPTGRAPAHVRAARPPRRLPGDAGREPALSRRRDRPPAGDPGRTALRDRAAAGSASAVAAPAPVAAASEAFTGLGFDACAAPSSRTMSAWAASPYRAIGVYIGGANRGLLAAQPDRDLGRRTGRRRLAPDPDLRRPAGADQRLQQLRQAELEHRRPSRGPKRPSDAVEEAQSVGMGPGSPIYFDMEAYTRTTSASRGDADLPLRLDRRSCTRSATSPASTAPAPRASPTSAARSAAATRCPTTSGPPTGTAQQNTLDPYLPSTAWAAHQRIHQYRGGHDETYGLMTINIDNNYVEGATVGAAIAAAANCRR